MSSASAATAPTPALRHGTGVALVITAGILWSLQGLVIRQIHESGSWTVLFWRSVGMMPVLLAFLVWRSRGLPWLAIRRVGFAGVLGGIGLVFAFAGAIYSLQATTIANAVFLFAASPLLAALMGVLILRERVQGRTWVAIAIAMVGIFVMVREGLALGAAAGNVGALLSALGFAAFTVSLRWRRVDDTLPSVLLGSLFAAATGAAVATLLGQPILVPWPDAAWAMAMGAVTLTGGMVLYTLGSRVVPAAEAALLANVEVMLAPVWVWLVLGESASLATFVGGAIILAALVLNGLGGLGRRGAA